MRWADERQVALYLTAMAGAALVGTLLPHVARSTAGLVTPILALLLYATFLGIPFARLTRAARDVTFLIPLLTLNFVLVPAVVFALSRFVAGEHALLLGVLMVLLCPCVDYVMVFTGLAGGATERLLAASPLLMLAQMLLLPLYVRVMAGPDVVGVLDLAPFAEAFVLLIVVPLGAAVLTQRMAGSRVGRAVHTAASGLMVPLMMLTLAVVVASQIARVGARLSVLAPVVVLFVAFAAIMCGVGWVTGVVSGHDAAARRALVFSGVTRNSLVVLPLALALPAAYAVTPLVVVTQTVVELVIMTTMVRWVPRAIPE